MPTPPAYLRVKEQLLRDLSDLSTPVGKSWPTESELQERYQVSRPTISKALTALVAEGVLTRVPGRRGFVVARPTEETRPPILRIGHVAVVNTLGPSALFQLQQYVGLGVCTAAERQGYRVVSSASGLSVARERAAVEDLLAIGVQGLVISSCPRSLEEQATDYLIHEDLGVPVVLTGMLPQGNPHAAVVFDNRRLNYEVTSTLLAQGHRRIGLLTRPTEIYHLPLRERLQGYKDAHRDHSLPVDPALILALPPAVQQWDRNACLHTTLETLLDRWLALPERPTALIALEDLVAIEFIELLQQRGLRVPEDMTVFGFDNLEIGRHFQPAFPTTQPDFQRMGELACNVLLNGIASGELPQQTYVLPVPLLLRGTSP
ncbi:substrate-binding domain-containing protein [Armatimonas sp.]|uniref:substrate-binding domain-containing protein n=1 Tax=Armatimonas sp. TaxID=1872638 RepID=UPI00286C9110|nr:substrate-binding domain-containing protein [Armatimonas sp.]